MRDCYFSPLTDLFLKGPSLDGVVISCAMDFLLNGANLFAILFVSPIFCSVGSLLLIPLNVLMQLIGEKKYLEEIL